jgi:hypothetical protein
MAETQTFFTTAKTVFKDYIEDRKALLKLQAAEKISSAAAGAVSGVLLAFIGLFILVFLSITGGFFFGSLTGSNTYGFAIITGIYILLFILILVLKKTVIEKKIIEKTLSGFFGPKEK